MEKYERTGILVAASLALGFGISTVLQSHASWYGLAQISGGQAKAVGVLFIIFSLLLFFSYFRKGKRN